MKKMKEKWHSLKVLIKVMIEFKPMIFVIILLNTLVNSILPLMQLLLSAQVIEWLMNEVPLQTYLTRLLGFVAIIGVVQLGKLYFTLFMEENREYFRGHTREKIKEKYITLDYPLVIGKEAQEKYNNANELTYNNGTLFGRVLEEWVELFSAFFGLILYINILSQLEWTFLLLVATFFLFVVFFNVLHVKMDQKLFHAKAAITQKLKYLRKVYGESRITKDVRIFQMVPWFNQVEHEVMASYHSALKPKVKLSWTENTVLNFGIIGLSALSYIRSVQLIAAGEIPVSSFVVYAGSVTILAQTIMTFGTTFGKFSNSLNETKKYDEFMTQGSVFNHGQGRDLPEPPFAIELKDVSYTYPNNEQPTIENLSLTIHPNEKLAIVGENGAGKSTLTNLISGLIKPDAGEIFINGIPQSECNIQEYYSLFSPVFQEKFILTYTIKETIIQGLPYDEEKYRRVIELSGMEQIIEKFDKKDETHIVRAVDKVAVALSGGQIQKLKLAQALYKDAPILILDEPTAALDAIAEHQIYQDYFYFSKEKTSLFVSHRLSSTRFCDRIIYIKEGNIAEMGTHEELMKNQEDYYELYEAQSYYYKNDKEGPHEESEEIVTGGVL